VIGILLAALWVTPIREASRLEAAVQAAAGEVAEELRRARP